MTRDECSVPEPVERVIPRKRATRSRTTKSTAAAPAMEVPEEAVEPPVFDPDIVARMRELAPSGLNPESALRLLARLMAEVPAASKEIMDRIKMIDTLIKTSRSMMETKLKIDDVAALISRLDDLEAHLEHLEPANCLRADQAGELWTRPEA